MLFEKSSDGILLFHERDGVIDCNEAVLEMFGCRDKTEIQGLHLASFAEDVQTNGRPSLEMAQEMGAIARRDGCHRFDWWCRRKTDGLVFPCEMTLTPVEIGDPASDLAEGSLLLTVLHDLTERKQYEEELTRARRSSWMRSRASIPDW